MFSSNSSHLQWLDANEHAHRFVVSPLLFHCKNLREKRSSELDGSKFAKSAQELLLSCSS